MRGAVRGRVLFSPRQTNPPNRTSQLGAVPCYENEQSWIAIDPWVDYKRRLGSGVARKGPPAVSACARLLPAGDSCGAAL